MECGNQLQSLTLWQIPDPKPVMIPILTVVKIMGHPHLRLIRPQLHPQPRETLRKQNYHIYLDLHLSDNWADPQHDYAPAAWPTTLDALASIVRTYARENLTTFHHVGVPLSLISLGNEIRHGMLWPLGEANVDITPTSARVANFTNLATLRASARSGLDDAVNAGATKPQVLSHIDNGWNLTLQQNWFSALTGSGKLSVPDWDVFSVSLDLFYGTNATLANLKRRLNGLAAQYGKPLHVVETD